jgi:hypothetical protein
MFGHRDLVVCARYTGHQSEAHGGEQKRLLDAIHVDFLSCW